MIKILNEITHRPYLPDMNFELLDIEIYMIVTCHVSTDDNTTIQSEGKNIVGGNVARCDIFI